MGYLLTDHDYNPADDILTADSGDYLTDELMAVVFKLDSYILDHGLSTLVTWSDEITLCSGEPQTYVEATATYILGSKNFGSPGSAFTGGITDATPSGRKVTTAQVVDGSISVPGLGTHVAVIDNAGERLHAVGRLSIQRPVLAGDKFKLPPFTITVPRGNIVGAYATLDPNHLYGLSLSNGNLAATGTSTGAIVRGTSSKSTGKFYFEAFFTVQAGNQQCGLVNGSFDLGNVAFGSDNNAIAINASSGFVYRDNSLVGTGDTWAAGHYCCCAVDFDVDKVWFRTDDGLWLGGSIETQNPATGVGGIDISAMTGPFYFAVSPFSVDDVVNMKIGTYDFAAPDGYGKWTA